MLQKKYKEHKKLGEQKAAKIAQLEAQTLSAQETVAALQQRISALEQELHKAKTEQLNGSAAASSLPFHGVPAAAAAASDDRRPMDPRLARAPSVSDAQTQELHEHLKQATAFIQHQQAQLFKFREEAESFRQWHAAEMHTAAEARSKHIASLQAELEETRSLSLEEINDLRSKLERAEQKQMGVAAGNPSQHEAAFAAVVKQRDELKAALDTLMAAGAIATAAAAAANVCSTPSTPSMPQLHPQQRLLMTPCVRESSVESMHQHQQPVSSPVSSPSMVVDKENLITPIRPMRLALSISPDVTPKLPTSRPAAGGSAMLPFAQEKVHTLKRKASPNAAKDPQQQQTSPLPPTSSSQLSPPPPTATATAAPSTAVVVPAPAVPAPAPAVVASAGPQRKFKLARNQLAASVSPSTTSSVTTVPSPRMSALAAAPAAPSTTTTTGPTTASSTASSTPRHSFPPPSFTTAHSSSNHSSSNSSNSSVSSVHDDMPELETPGGMSASVASRLATLFQHQPANKLAADVTPPRSVDATMSY